MDPRTFPTKGNLMLAKNSLALAKQGYDLMDKKRTTRPAVSRRRSTRPLLMPISVSSARISKTASAM